MSNQPSNLYINQASHQRYQDFEDAAYLDALYADQPDYVELEGLTLDGYPLTAKSYFEVGN